MVTLAKRNSLSAPSAFSFSIRLLRSLSRLLSCGNCCHFFFSCAHIAFPCSHLNKKVYDTDDASLEARLKQHVHYIQRRAGDSDANAFRKDGGKRD